MEQQLDFAGEGASSRQAARCLPAWAEEVVRRYGRSVRARVWRTLVVAGARARAEQVEELTQETYCRVLSAGRSGCQRLAACWGSGTQVEAYLCRVAERVVLDELRAARALKRDWRRLARRGRLSPDPRDPAGTPLERLLAEEQRNLFLARCRRLAGGRTGPRDTRIVQLALLDGWTSVEISRALGGLLAPSSIDSLVHRLKRRLAAEGVEVPRRERGPWVPARPRRVAAV